MAKKKQTKSKTPVVSGKLYNAILSDNVIVCPKCEQVVTEPTCDYGLTSDNVNFFVRPCINCGSRVRYLTDGNLKERMTFKEVAKPIIEKKVIVVKKSLPKIIGKRPKLIMCDLD